jgi:hypothetical protein
VGDFIDRHVFQKKEGQNFAVWQSQLEQSVVNLIGIFEVPKPGVFLGFAASRVALQIVALDRAQMAEVMALLRAMRYNQGTSLPGSLSVAIPRSTLS